MGVESVRMMQGTAMPADQLASRAPFNVPRVLIGVRVSHNAHN